MEWKVAPSYSNGQIIEINEDEHKALVREVCPRCGGSGAYVLPNFVGTCFKCEGFGYSQKWVKAYTPKEYEKYIANQEKARAKRVEQHINKMAELDSKSEENKKACLTKMGFDAENPVIKLVVGNTYEIKDWIKSRGGRFNSTFNWYFCGNAPELPEGYVYATVNVDDVYDWFPRVKRLEIKENAAEVVKTAKEASLPPSDSEYVGEIKERLRQLNVTLTGARAVDGMYGTSIMFTFDYNGNSLVWFTSCPPDEEDAKVGETYLLTGTVKKHEVYNGVKQTYLSRCKLEKV